MRARTRRLRSWAAWHGQDHLFKSLIGILPAKSGRIVVAGNDVSHDESYRRVAKGIAYVPQGRMILLHADG